MGNPLAVDITNSDGTSTVVHQYGNTESVKASIIVWPALGVKASYYETLANELCSRGFLVFTADLRGNGKSSIRPSRKVNFGYADVLDQEFTSVVQHVAKTFPDKKILLFGHSIGGQLSCLFASRKTVKIDGLILSGTCSVYYKGWNGFSAYRILALTQFINLVSKLTGYFPGKKLGFGGTEARGLMADWSKQARSGRYEIDNDSYNYEKELRLIKLPILSISYEGDEMAPKGAVEHLLNKLSLAKKEHIHLLRGDSRNESFSHFNWVKKPKNIVEIVDNWVAGIQ